MEKQSDYRELARVCRNWWSTLQSRDKDGKPIGIGESSKVPDRAALAQLRRIDVIDLGGAPGVDVGTALGIPAFRNLISRLRRARDEGKVSNRRLLGWLSEVDPEMAPFAIAAATLARVGGDSGNKAERPGATARLLGAARSEGGGNDDHLFAEARFKQLIRTRDDWPSLMKQARRVAAILEREAPVGDLGASLVLWNADPRIGRDWAFQYYQREFEPAAPSDETEVAALSANV